MPLNFLLFSVSPMTESHGGIGERGRVTAAWSASACFGLCYSGAQSAIPQKRVPRFGALVIGHLRVFVIALIALVRVTFPCRAANHCLSSNDLRTKLEHEVA
jgi:hypothetical protein